MMNFFSSFKKITGITGKKEKAADNTETKPYGKVSDEELESVYVIVQHRLSDPLVYTKESLSLAEFSKEIKICAYKVSLAINKIGKQNFKNILNECRVNKAKELLKDIHYGHYTVDAIAMEVGFSNRMSFCKAFKKFTGKSPHEFRLECLK